MSRPRDSGSHFDSFPFLNIMLGMIVVMVLFMLIITTRATDQQQQAAAVPISAESGPLARPSRGRSGARDADLDEEQYRQLLLEISELESRVAERRGQVGRLLKQRAELDSRLQALEDAAIETALGNGLSESGYIVGKPDPTIMIPDARVRATKLPRFITVEADTYTVHHDDRKTKHRADELDVKNSPLEKFLAEISNRRANEYPLLLVKPNGADEFAKLRERIIKLAETGRPARGPRENLDIGWEPFDPAWLLLSNESRQSP